jgi:gas vesicle protein
MMVKELKERLIDLLPFQRRSGAWVFPAFVGLGVGVVAGIGIGVLVAPESGADTRKRLARRAEDIQRRASMMAERARGEISSTAHQIARETESR